MKRFFKLKAVIIGTLCLITLIAIIALSSSNKVNDNKTNPITSTEEETITIETSPDINNIDESQCYSIIGREVSWAVDPSEPKNLLQLARDTSIIKVKVRFVGKALFFEKTKDFSSIEPFTPVGVTVEKTLEGQPLNDIKTIYLSGGVVTIAEDMKSMDQGTIEKRGYDKLTKAEQETKYVYYKTGDDYKLIPDEEYAFIVAKQPNDTYTIMCKGYGIFKEDISGDSSKTVFKNVLTGKELTDENGTVITLK